MDNRPSKFMNIFSLQGSDDDQTSIAKQSNQVNNYNSITSAHLRTNSMETVWAYDMDVSTSNENSPPPVETSSNYGIPSMLRTTHMEMEYDPHDFGNTDNPTSFWSTVIHLIIISAGPAILSLPVSFLQVGYAIGLIGTLISVYLYAYSMQTLLWSEYEICKSNRVPHLSYPDLIYFAFKDGPARLRWFAEFGRYTINVVFIVLWASGCCYNLTLAAENIHIVYNSRWTHTNKDVHTIMGWLIIPILLLCWVPRLKYLVPVSVIANLANVLCIGAVIYDVIFSKKPFEGASAIGSTSQLPLFLGTVFFSINATGLILSLKKEMKEPGRFNSPFGVLTITYTLVFFMYALFSLLCSFKYGSSVKKTVTWNVEQGQSLTEYMILANALALIFQYPLLAYVIFDVIWNNMMKESKKIWANLVVWEYLLRTGITMAIFLITYVLPSVELFLTFGGAVGTMLDSLIFPAIIQTLVMWKTSKNKRTFNRCLYKSLAISVLAIVLMVTGGASCLNDILRHYSGGETTR